MANAKSVKICGFDFEIRRQDFIFERGQACLGVCRSDNNEILIKTGLKPRVESEVLLHESIHAMSDIMNLELSEDQVNALAVLLLNYLSDNKKVTQKILDND